jgi:aldehyde dehydrogenase (NAD+)
MSDRLLRLQWDNYIGGAFSPPGNGDYLEEFDPRSGRASYRIARSGKGDVDHAVRSAATAQPAWAALRPSGRGHVLYAMAQALREAETRERLVALDQYETGRTPAMCLWEVELAAQYFEFYAGLVNAHQSQVVDLGANYHSYTRHEPFGVVGIILPWNGPLNQAARGIAPALAVGNSVVAKPSEFTSVTLLELARLAVERCGLPAGLLNVVTGTGAETGAALVAHERIRKVAFTGSVRTGQEIGKIAAERIIPLGLELGGKSPNIVFEDADLEQAVAGSLKAFVLNTGQVCSAGTRLLVQRTIHDKFVNRLRTAMEKVTIGSGPNDMMGPIITRTQYEKVRSYCTLAAAEGAEVFSTGRLPGSDAQGWYVQPTMFTKVSNDMRVAREEIFGPIVSVIAFDSEDEAVRIANDTEYGLVAGVWTSNLSRAHRISARLEAGQIYVNEYFAGGIETPFGGFKKSGYGREKGLEALNHYTQMKCVTIRL